MRHRRLAWLLALPILGAATTGALAQDDWDESVYEYSEYAPEPEIKEGRTVLFTPKHVDVRQLQSVLDLVNAYVEVKPELNLIAARSADEAELETIRQIIETLDVAPEPEPNVELTAYILTSSSGKTAAAGVPAELAEDVDRLAARFGFSDLQLLDTIFLRVGAGSGGRVEGSFPLGSSDQLSGYQFYFDGATVFQQEEVRLVRLAALTFLVTGENPAGVHRALMRTDFEIHDGEKAMVGKATPRGVEETLVLLLEAEIRE